MAIVHNRCSPEICLRVVHNTKGGTAAHVHMYSVGHPYNRIIHYHQKELVERSRTLNCYM